MLDNGVMMERVKIVLIVVILTKFVISKLEIVYVRRVIPNHVVQINGVMVMETVRIALVLIRDKSVIS